MAAAPVELAAAEVKERHYYAVDGGVGKLQGHLVKRVQVHTQRITSLLAISEEIISCSLDGKLKRFNNQGKELDSLYSYFSFTSLSHCGEEYWLSGTDLGMVNIRKHNGKLYKSMHPSPPQANKDNIDQLSLKVHCLSQGTDRFGDPIFFAGWEGGFTVHKPNKKTLGGCVIENETVFHVEQLTERETGYLVATDRSVNFYDSSKDFKKWEISRQLHHPKSSKISSIESLAFGLFYYIGHNDGEMLLLNVGAGESESRKEHTRRVCQTVQVPKLSAWLSGSEDGTVKLWDLRQKKSVKTLDGNEGEVTAIVALSENLFVYGSCPENVPRYNKIPCASLSFLDIRKI